MPKDDYYAEKPFGVFKRKVLDLLNVPVAYQHLVWDTRLKDTFSSRISTQEWAQIALYVIAKRGEHTAEAKKAGYPIHIHSHLKLPRSIVVTPEGQVFVLFNKISGGADEEIGRGATNHAKHVINFDTGEKKVIVTPHRAPGETKIQRVVDILYMLPKDASFLKHHALFFDYIKGTQDPKYYIIMDAIDKTVKEIEPTQLGFNEANCKIGLSLLESLEKLHAKGIYHRDIKPANVGVTGDQGYLIDFDLAVTQDDESLNYSTGSPGYTAGWFLNDPGIETVQQNDVYGLGIVLCLLLTGRNPRDEVVAELIEENSGEMPSREDIKQASPRVQRKLHEVVDASANLPQEMKSLLKEMVGDDSTKTPSAQEAYQRFSKASKKEAQ